MPMFPLKVLKAERDLGIAELDGEGTCTIGVVLLSLELLERRPLVPDSVTTAIEPTARVEPPKRTSVGFGMDEPL
jgi:hypothetical protein